MQGGYGQQGYGGGGGGGYGGGADVISLTRAVFAFQGRDNIELSLTEGDLISILSKNADGPEWWRGRAANGREGIFPASYVREIDAPDDLDYKLSPQQAKAVGGKLYIHTHNTIN